jgi:type IV secretion system protein VirB1
MAGSTLTLAAFLALAPQCAPGVHPDTLGSVIHAESRFGLYRIGINHQGRQVSSRSYNSKQEAVAAAELLIGRGVGNLDLGPAQISWKAGHLQRRGLPPAAAFEPCTALRIAADVLRDCWARAPGREEQARLDETAACYNSGRFLRPEYVRNVRASAAVVVPALRVADAASSPAQAPVHRPKQEPEPESWDVFAEHVPAPAGETLEGEEDAAPSGQPPRVIVELD